MNRLRSYRDIERISQQELGDRLGLSAPMVSSIESGRRAFGGDLNIIGYSASRFEIPDMSEPLHRNRASTAVVAKKRAKELIRLAGEVFADLRTTTEGVPIARIERQRADVHLEEFEELALEARSMLGREEEGPIRNLTSAIERAGVCVIPIAGLDGIDALSAWVGDVPVIGLSPSLPGDRFRFTLSHELAHLLFHFRRTESVEREANQFAGALLFPRADFELAMPEAPQLRDFIALKSAWGISVAALVYRARELGFLDDRRYRALQIQMSKWHRSEPGSFLPEYGQLMTRLIQVNGGLAKVSTTLGINRNHLSELTNWSHLRLA